MRCVGGKSYLKNGSVPTRFSFSPVALLIGKECHKHQHLGLLVLLTHP